MLFTSCFEDNDDNGALASEINDFVWKGMNAVYLYKDDVPDLANMCRHVDSIVSVSSVKTIDCIDGGIDWVIYWDTIGVSFWVPSGSHINQDAETRDAFV